MPRPKETGQRQLEKIIRSHCWYYTVKSALSAKSDYEISRKVGDKQPSKWTNYRRFTGPNSTTVTLVDKVVVGSKSTFYEGPEETKLFSFMFDSLEGLGVLNAESFLDIPAQYSLLSSGFDQGRELSFRDMIKSDFDQFIEGLGKMDLSEVNLLQHISIHCLYLRAFIARSRYVSSASTAAEKVLRLSINLLSTDEVEEKLDFYGIYLFVCDWFFYRCEEWKAISCPDLELDRNEFYLDPSCFIRELNQTQFYNELNNEVMDPSGQYQLSHAELEQVF